MLAVGHERMPLVFRVIGVVVETEDVTLNLRHPLRVRQERDACISIRDLLGGRKIVSPRLDR